VKHHANPRFWRCYQGLPKEIRDLADRNYALLKSDSIHGSLQKVGSLWSVRVGLHYRALATEVGGDLVWFCDRLTRGIRHARGSKAGEQGAAADEPRSNEGQVEAAFRRVSRLSASAVRPMDPEGVVGQ